MSDDKDLLFCYNRGCGKKFSLKDNPDDACQHHPGAPIFHDAYKIWSCCNKKCIDFTEFLNIKGCTKSKHSDIKPEEPKKPAIDKSKADEVIEVISKPLNNISTVERPPFNSPQVTLKPTVAPLLLEQIKGLIALDEVQKDNSAVVIGQSCKNNSCKASYKGPQSNEEVCTYHPGAPIFHEGMKYWSCCQKKTMDFAVFLEQPGCTQGTHVWTKKETDKAVKCRMDWHQTGTHVIVSIYAKKYNPSLSYVKLNPIRLTIDLYFPEENSRYNLDTELRGVVDVEASSVNMLTTKVEIKLRKQEPGSWSKLDISRKIEAEKPKEACLEKEISEQVDAVDLSDL